MRKTNKKPERTAVIVLSFSTAALAVVSAILLTVLMLRPVITETEYLPALDSAGQVVLDLGNGKKIIAPGDGVIVFDGDLDSLTEPKTYERTDSASGRGVEITTRGGDGKFVLTMDFGSPDASIPDGPRGLAGWANLGIKAMFTSGGSFLYILAGLLIAGGVIVGIWLKQWKLGIALTIAGLTLYATVQLFTSYPWVLWLFMGTIAVMGGIILYDYWKSRRKSLTVDSVVAAADQLPDKIKAIFTKLVRGEAQARGAEAIVKSEVQQTRQNGGAARSRLDISDKEMELYDHLQKKSGIQQVQPQQPQIILVPSSAVTSGTEVVAAAPAPRPQTKKKVTARKTKRS